MKFVLLENPEGIKYESKIGEANNPGQAMAQII